MFFSSPLVSIRNIGWLDLSDRLETSLLLVVAVDSAAFADWGLFCFLLFFFLVVGWVVWEESTKLKIVFIVSEFFLSLSFLEKKLLFKLKFFWELKEVTVKIK